MPPPVAVNTELVTEQVKLFADVAVAVGAVVLDVTATLAVAEQPFALRTVTV